MRNLFKLMTMGMLIMTLAACGKNNSSGGGSTGASGGSTSLPVTGQSFSTYTELKNHFVGTSLANGVSSGMVVYHMGPAYGGRSFGSSSIDFNLDFGFCINFFGYTKGDCNGNQNQTSGLVEILDRGEYKSVVSASTDIVDFDVADGVSGNSFTFSQGTYDRDLNIYRNMLNLNNDPVRKVVISDANIVLDNGSRLAASYVEYFYNDGSLEGYILSRDIPTVANPIAITANHDLKGALSFSGNITIKSIGVQIHTLDYDFRTNSYTPRVIGTRSISF